MKGIILENKLIFNGGLELIAKRHYRYCGAKGPFSMTEDEAMCVWGLGMANLGRLHGLPVTLDHPLIPKPLILP